MATAEERERIAQMAISAVEIGQVALDVLTELEVVRKAGLEATKNWRTWLDNEFRGDPNYDGYMGELERVEKMILTGKEIADGKEDKSAEDNA